jgi:REP element-mobilizing transposase RayT
VDGGLYPIRRDSLRWDNWRYEDGAAYFVTICVRDMQCLFGRVERDEMVLNRLGAIVAESWLGLERRFERVVLGESVVMPNHFHGIIRLGHGGSTHLGRVVGVFKGASAFRINALRGTPGAPVWQRGYFDRVIRDSAEYERVRVYVVQNPLCWHLDHLNPGRRGG